MRFPFLGDSKDYGGDNKEGKIALLEQMYKGCDQVRRHYESEWFSNALFLAGNCYEEVAEDVRRYRKIPVQAPSTKVKIASNWLFSLARQASTSFRDSLSRQVARQATEDPEDIEAARIATDFLDYRYEQDEEAEIRFFEVIWTMVCGRVLRKTIWDADKDGITEFGRLKRVGDIHQVSLNPFQYYVDPGVDQFRNAAFVIEVDVRDVQEVNDVFGSDVESEEIAYSVKMLDRLAVNVVGVAGYVVPPKRKESCILKRLWMRPCREFPNGRLIYWANGKLLREEDLPFGIFPFVELDWFYIPGRAYPLPFCTPIRDPQKEYNYTLSQLCELKNRQLRADMVIRGGTGGDADMRMKVDPKTGRRTIILGSHIQEFEFLRYDLNAQEAEFLLARLFNDGQQAAGVRDPSMGKNPPGVTTATGLALLQEKDVQGLAVFRFGFDLSHSKISKHKLAFAREGYDIPRMIRVTGRSNKVRVYSFFGAELRNTEDVVPKPEPLLTETQKQQIKQEAIQGGLYGPYASPGDKLAKLTALLNTGLPGVEEEVAARLHPLDLEQWRQLCSQIDMLGAQLLTLALQQQISQLQGGGGEEQSEQSQLPGGAPPQLTASSRV